MPEVTRFVVGPIQSNAYIVKKGEDAILVDPGARSSKLERAAEAQGVRLVVCTHGHYDHIEGVAFYRERGIPIAIGELDADCLTDPSRNLSTLMGGAFSLKRGADRILEEGMEVTLGALSFVVRHVPGHSQGSIALYGHGMLFSGDVLFQGSIGRADLPGGDREVLFNSISEVLYSLPDETRVYPGHGPETTIAREKRSNPFVRG